MDVVEVLREPDGGDGSGTQQHDDKGLVANDVVLLICTEGQFGRIGLKIGEHQLMRSTNLHVVNIVQIPLFHVSGEIIINIIMLLMTNPTYDVHISQVDPLLINDREDLDKHVSIDVDLVLLNVLNQRLHAFLCY